MICARGLFAGATMMAWLCWVSPSRADHMTFRFGWVRGQGAESCADQQRISSEITMRLGWDPFASHAERSIEAFVKRNEAVWRVEIFVRDKKGEAVGARELTSDALDCSAVESASVLAIALAIDPDAQLAPSPGQPQPPGPPQVLTTVSPIPFQPAPTVAPVASVAGPVRAPSVAVQPPLDGRAVAAGRAVGAVGIVPSMSWGVGMAADIPLARRVHGIGESMWIPESRSADGLFGFGLAAFSLGVCGSVWVSPKADAGFCGAAWAGAVHSVVYSLAPTRPGDRAWAAVSLTPRARFGLSERFVLEGGMHVQVPMIRQPFTVTGWSSPVFQPWPVALVGFAGLGVHFP